MATKLFFLAFCLTLGEEVVISFNINHILTAEKYYSVRPITIPWLRKYITLHREEAAIIIQKGRRIIHLERRNTML